MDTVECLLQCCSKTAIVYTTRLEHMEILRKSTKGQSFEKIVKAIIAESKPSPTDNKTFSVKLNKSKMTAFEKLTIRGSRIQSESCQIQVIKQENDDGHSCEYSVCDSENEDNFAVEETQPLNQKHLGTCKQLRVVLVDILKNIPKKIDEGSTEVLSISSDDDNDNNNVIESTENITAHNTRQEVEIEDQEIECLQLQDDIIQTDLCKTYVVKSVDDFKEILEQNNFKNSLILIYNKFMGDVDAIQIDEMPSVAKCLRVKNAASIKSTVLNSQKIYSINACCWNIRYAFVGLLGNYTNYSKGATFMYRQHPCRVFYCRCCCKIPENIFYRVKKKDIIKSAIKAAIHNDLYMDNNEEEAINKDKLKNNYVDIINKRVTKKLPSEYGTNSEPINIAIDERHTNYITAALQFPILLKRESKPKKYLTERLFLSRANPSAKLETSKFIKISHADGSDDIYELGYQNNIIGKITNDSNRLNSCWLSKTYKNLDQLNLKEGTSIVPTYISCFSNVESSTKIFFAYLNERVSFHPYDPKASRKNKTDNDKSTTTLPNVNDEIRIRENNLGSNHEKSNEKFLQPEAVTEDNMSNTVRILIDAFMKRFQNVRLRINDQGEVAAAFNAPISYLKTAELKILSNILNYAQEQVNKLGLKPGTSFSTEKLMPHTLPNEFPSATDEVKMLNKNEGDATTKSGTTESQDNQYEISVDKNDVIQSHTKKTADDEIKNQVLTKFSGIISEKKTGYLNSFRQYLGGITQTVPKISNVVSINKDNNSPNGNSKSKDNTAIIINNEFPQSPRRRMRKYKLEMESTSGTKKRQKRKNDFENLDNPQRSQKRTRSNSLTKSNTLSEDGTLVDEIISSTLEPQPVKLPEVIIASSEDYQLLSSEVSDPLMQQRTENTEDTFDATTIAGGSRLRTLLASKPKQMVFPTIVID